MQPSVAEALRSILAGVAVDGNGFSGSHPSPQTSGGWIVTVVSLLALLAAGGIAARVARLLIRRSTPELTVLLNESAAFYARWPEDRLANAPQCDVRLEAERCRRIIALLEGQSRGTEAGGSALRGSIDGLRAWIIVLGKRIESVAADATTGASYA